MYTKNQLNQLYERIIKSVDISDEMFDKAEAEYMSLGNWIDKRTPLYKISIYPQGSFALGTVIKPLADTDDYDLDLVCEFAQQYGLSAEDLKVDTVKNLLTSYNKTKGALENKRRCWHVEYEDIPNFHMDVIPAINHVRYIDITDHDEERDEYSYIVSNSKGYIEWFNRCKAKRRKAICEAYVAEHHNVIKCQADIDAIKEYNLKTPLQKAIQLLKRHRDIMFEKKDEQLKPISIIITTIAAQLYQKSNADNIVDALVSILGGAEQYIKDNMVGREYHIDNPCYSGGDTENFADKWNEHPERVESFIAWIKKGQNDLIGSNIYELTRVQMADNIKESLGNTTGTRVFNEMAKEERTAIEKQKAKVDPANGMITKTGSIPIPANHHHGK